MTRYPTPTPRGDSRKMVSAKELADAAIAEWQDAYRKANGKEPPHIVYRSGWVVIREAKKRRVSDLLEMTKVLRRRANAEPSE